MKVNIKKEKIILLLKIVILVIIDQILKILIFTNKQILPIQLIESILKINYIVSIRKKKTLSVFLSYFISL